MDHGFEKEYIAAVVVRWLGLICHMPDLTEWATKVHRARHPKGMVTIDLVGKYVALHDAYLSVVEFARNVCGLAGAHSADECDFFEPRTFKKVVDRT